MPRRGTRLALRIIGWILTPLVVISCAAIGAIIGLTLAPRFAPATALIVTAALALVASGVGLVLWVRLLRTHPRLQRTFAVTPEGLPDTPAVEHLLHPDAPNRDQQ